MWSVIVLAQYAGSTNSIMTPAVWVIPGFASQALADAAATAIGGMSDSAHWRVIAKSVQNS